MCKGTGFQRLVFSAWPPMSPQPWEGLLQRGQGQWVLAEFGVVLWPRLPGVYRPSCCPQNLLSSAKAQSIACVTNTGTLVVRKIEFLFTLFKWNMNVRGMLRLSCCFCWRIYSRTRCWWLRRTVVVVLPKGKGSGLQRHTSGAETALLVLLLYTVLCCLQCPGFSCEGHEIDWAGQWFQLTP